MIKSQCQQFNKTVTFIFTENQLNTCIEYDGLTELRQYHFHTDIIIFATTDSKFLK